MKVKGEAYQKKVEVPKVWEEIIDETGKKQRVLVTEVVSQYIRRLEPETDLTKLETEGHKDKFTGIFDKNGVPIMNGDLISVIDDYHMKLGRNVGTVIWKNGGYECEGTATAYNIWAWRKSIVVQKTDRPSVHRDMTIAEIGEYYARRAAPALKKLNSYDVLKAFQEGMRYQQEQEWIKSDTK